MTTTSRLSAKVLLISFTLYTALPAVAQQTPAPAGTPRQQIGEVTLFGEEQLKVEAATKTEIPISNAPSAVTVVTAKQIRESGSRTVPDLLRLVAGVNVRWNPMVQTIDVRGFGENPFSNRILLLIDGVPYNSGDTGGFPLSPAFDFFPIQNIKRVEVVRGPGSSLYGENAYWGVINIVTLSGEDLAGGEAQLYGGSRGSGSISAQYGTRFTNGDFLGAVRILNGEFPMEFWRESDSKFKASDVFLKGTYKDFGISYYRHDDSLDGFREELHEPGLPPGSVFASAHDIKQTIDILTLKYNHAPQNAPVTFSADVSYSHRDGMHCAGCHAAQQAPEFSERADHGYQAIADLRMGLNVVRGHDILVGVEGRRLDRGDHEEELSPEGHAVSGYEKFAVYAQDQFSVIPDKLRAVVGVRYDAKSDLFDAKTSPRLALVYTPTDRLVVRGGYSSAFRFPNFSELYQDSWFLGVSNELGLAPAFPLVTFVPNPHLRPEEIRTLELGGEYQISPTVSAKVDLYRSKVKNFMVLTAVLAPPPNPAGLRFENHPAEATISGGEVELRANFTGGITGFVNWGHQSASRGSGVDSGGLPLEFVYAPKNKINVGAFAGPFNGVRGAVEVAWRGEYVGPFFQYLVQSNFTDPTIRPFDSYALVNGRISYDLPFNFGPKDRPIRLSLFGNNLLDERQRETLIGVDTSLTGREFYAQVEVNF
jgi:iron complex outermembrane receptor protein